MRPNFAKVLLAVIAVIFFASVCANAQALVTDKNGTFIVSPTGERTAVQCAMSFPFLKGLEAIESDTDPKLGEGVVAVAFSGINVRSNEDAFASTSQAQSHASSPAGTKAKRFCACSDSFRAQSNEPTFIPR